MATMTAVPAPPVMLTIPSRFAADRLLRLRDLLTRRRNAERMLHGPDRDQALALVDRAVLVLFHDCRDAGVEDDALQILLRSRERAAASPVLAA